MTTLPDLIAELEALEGPSREVDARIGVAVGDVFLDGKSFGEPRYSERDKDGRISRPGRYGDQLVSRYTASIYTAVRLAERVLPGWELNLTIKDGKSVDTYLIGPEFDSYTFEGGSPSIGGKPPASRHLHRHPKGSGRGERRCQ